ncbi:MAG: hypothetical protein ACRCUY_14105 [Thermoguttaceae bacterium]
MGTKLSGEILGITFGISLAVFGLLTTTSAILPLTWDEGEMNLRSENVIAAFSDSPNVDLASSSFSTWRGTTSIEGHPQFPVILVAVGKKVAAWLFPRELNETQQLRFGPIVFVSIVLGIVFCRIKNDWGVVSAFCGLASILCIPRLFAHLQIAAWDSPLIASWLLAWSLFTLALSSWNGAVLFGLALGMTISCKFSGLGVLLPLFVCAFFVHKLQQMRIITSVFVAIISFVVLNPPIWHDPISGIYRWFALNLGRDINISILFLGEMFDLHHSLPWYNTIIWTGITVPIGILILFGFGIFRLIRSPENRLSGIFLLLNMLVLLIVRSFPGTPVHDGIRLFVPAFAFLGIISGIGAGFVVKFNFSFQQNRKFYNSQLNNSQQKYQQEKQRFSYLKKMQIRGLFFVSFIFMISLGNMIWFAPQWLSFYNGIIGGLSGAVKLGMEPTYYWDGFDSEVRAWIRQNCNENETIAFSAASTSMLQIYQNQGELPRFIVVSPEMTWQEMQKRGVAYYVIQNRQSALFRRDEKIRQEHVPIFVKTIRSKNFGIWNFSDVSLIEIYKVPYFEPMQ